MSMERPPHQARSKAPVPLEEFVADFLVRRVVAKRLNLVESEYARVSIFDWDEDATVLEVVSRNAVLLLPLGIKCPLVRIVDRQDLGLLRYRVQSRGRVENGIHGLVRAGRVDAQVAILRLRRVPLASREPEQAAQ